MKSFKLNVRNAFLLLASTLLLSSTACRFETPNAHEGKALVEGGAFPEGVPPWVMKSKEDAPSTAANAGFIPQRLSVPEAVKSTEASIPSTVVPSADSARFDASALARTALKAAEAPSAVDAVSDGSPLGKIEKACPGIEADVSDALQTTDVAARIRKYNAITARCSQSADIWVWLGRDYASSNSLMDASRCYETALSIDSTHAEAREGLSEIRGLIGETPSK